MYMQPFTFFKSIPLLNINYYFITSNKLYFYNIADNSQKELTTFIESKL